MDNGITLRRLYNYSIFCGFFLVNYIINNNNDDINFINLRLTQGEMGQIVERVVSRHSTHSHVNSLSLKSQHCRISLFNMESKSTFALPNMQSILHIGKTVANRVENLDPEKTSPTGVYVIALSKRHKRKTMDNLNAAINIRKGLHKLQTKVFEAYGKKLMVEFLDTADGKLAISRIDKVILPMSLKASSESDIPVVEDSSLSRSSKFPLYVEGETQCCWRALVDNARKSNGIVVDDTG